MLRLRGNTTSAAVAYALQRISLCGTRQSSRFTVSHPDSYRRLFSSQPSEPPSSSASASASASSPQISASSSASSSSAPSSSSSSSSSERLLAHQVLGQVNGPKTHAETMYLTRIMQRLVRNPGVSSSSSVKTMEYPVSEWSLQEFRMLARPHLQPNSSTMSTVSPSTSNSSSSSPSSAIPGNLVKSDSGVSGESTSTSSSLSSLSNARSFDIVPPYPLRSMNNATASPSALALETLAAYRSGIIVLHHRNPHSPLYLERIAMQIAGELGADFLAVNELDLYPPTRPIHTNVNDQHLYADIDAETEADNNESGSTGGATFTAATNASSTADQNKLKNASQDHKKIPSSIRRKTPPLQGLFAPPEVSRARNSVVHNAMHVPFETLLRLLSYASPAPKVLFVSDLRSLMVSIAMDRFPNRASRMDEEDMMQSVFHMLSGCISQARQHQPILMVATHTPLPLPHITSPFSNNPQQQQQRNNLMPNNVGNGSPILISGGGGGNSPLILAGSNLNMNLGNMAGRMPRQNQRSTSHHSREGGNGRSSANGMPKAAGILGMLNIANAAVSALSNSGNIGHAMAATTHVALPINDPENSADAAKLVQLFERDRQHIVSESNALSIAMTMAGMNLNIIPTNINLDSNNNSIRKENEKENLILPGLGDALLKSQDIERLVMLSLAIHSHMKLNLPETSSPSLSSALLDATSPAPSTSAIQQTTTALSTDGIDSALENSISNVNSIEQQSASFIPYKASPRPTLVTAPVVQKAWALVRDSSRSTPRVMDEESDELENSDNETDEEGPSGMPLMNFFEQARQHQQQLQFHSRMTWDKDFTKGQLVGSGLKAGGSLGSEISGMNNVGNSGGGNSNTSSSNRAHTAKYAHLDLDQYEKKLISSIIPPDLTQTKFSDVGSLISTKNTLDEIIRLPMRRPEWFRTGILGRQSTTGILLFGPPGTGKTMLAKAVAAEAGCSFINVSPSMIFDKWMGESQKNAKAVFTLARKIAPCIIFFDEVDALLVSRAMDNDTNSARRETLNEIMMEWDGLSSGMQRVLVMGATNRPFDLDDAVLRRFPRRILIDLPDESARLEILQIMLRDEKLGESVSLKDIAAKTNHFSGSDLKSLCISAALASVKDVMNLMPEKDEEGDEVPVTRILEKAHFDAAFLEVSASASESGLTMMELRNWDKQHGEGRVQRQSAQTIGF